jgi:hypothetical protein
MTNQKPSAFDRGMAVLAKVILGFLATLIVLCIGAHLAHCGEPVLTVMQRQPVYFEDRATPELKAVQLQDLATAIEGASQNKPPGVGLRDWQALLLTISYHETTWSLRIHRGDCKAHECDGGKARGPWQQHRNGRKDADWDALIGLEHTTFQAETASAQLRSSWLTCKGSGAPWLQGTINNYAGRKCTDTTWEGLAERQATWAKIRAKL